MIGRESTLPARATAAPAQDTTPLAYRIAHLAVITALKVLFRFEISGRVNIPRDRPYVVAANHLNWLDSFALLVALPARPRLHFVGWGNVLGHPRVSWFVKTTRAGFIPIERDPGKRAKRRRDLLRTLEQCLAFGNPLVLFPEGQVGCQEGELAPLHAGFARLAAMTGAPVLPVALSGTRRLWLRKRIRVVIAPSISADSQSVDDLMTRTRDALLAAMPAPIHDERGPHLFERKLTRLVPSLTNWEPSDLRVL